jgi:NIPSNAP
MALYELRTYTLYVGKMAEAVRLYQELGFPALNKGGHDKNLVGYFQGDTGTINQIVHLWKFATMPPVARTGRRCLPTLISPRASLPSSGRW